MTFYALATRFVRPWIARRGAGGARDRPRSGALHARLRIRSCRPRPCCSVACGSSRDAARRARRSRPSPGCCFGATVMARIDGPLYLVAIPFVVGAAVVARRRGDPDGRAALVAADVAGRRRRARDRARARRRAAAQHGVPARSRRPRRCCSTSGSRSCASSRSASRAWAPRLVTWPRAHGARAAPRLRGGLSSAAGLFGAWFVRPHVQTTHDRARHGHGGAASASITSRSTPTRRYYENSLVWHSWYLGPLALAAGIVGVALLTREVLRGRRGPIGLVAVAFLPVAAVYLANPSIFPEQIWVMRRFLPLVIPGFVLFAFVVVDRLLDGRSPRVVVAVADRRGRDRRRGDRVADPHRLAGSGRHDAVRIPRLRRAALPRGRGRRGRRGAPGRHPRRRRSPRRCGATATSRSPGASSTPTSPGLDAAGFARLPPAWKRDGRSLFIVADSPAAHRPDHSRAETDRPDLRPQPPVPRASTSSSDPTASDPRVPRSPSPAWREAATAPGHEAKAGK